MKRLNQKGDVALYIISVAVVIALIGFAGWRVWKSMEESKQSKTNSSTQTSEQSQNAPVSDLAEQKVEGTDLTFFYPITQGPITKDTREIADEREQSKIATYKLKDYVVEVNTANNMVIDLGLTGWAMCSYDVATDKITTESRSTLPCKYNKEMINGVAFYNTSIRDEVLSRPGFVAPTKDKQYVLYINRVAGSEHCQYGPPDDAKYALCIQADNDFQAELRADVSEFVAANPNLFE